MKNVNEWIDNYIVVSTATRLSVTQRAPATRYAGWEHLLSDDMLDESTCYQTTYWVERAPGIRQHIGRREHLLLIPFRLCFGSDTSCQLGPV